MEVARDRWTAFGAPGCLRWAGCLAVGLVAVHQLRLLAAPSSDGHAPLIALAVPSAVLLAGAAIALVVELAGIRRGRTPVPSRLSLRRAWVVASVALIVLFVAQELLEGMLLHGHASGLYGVFALGGWTAVPLAVAVGGVVALTLVGVRCALRRAAAPPRRPYRPLRVPSISSAGAWRPAGVLARKLASRAPPVAAA
jgi:hypothetical protein